MVVVHSMKEGIRVLSLLDASADDDGQTMETDDLVPVGKGNASRWLGLGLRLGLG